MDMAESIASACCYSVTTSKDGLVTTKNILTGGTITTLETYQVYQDLIEFYGGIASLPANHYTYYRPYSADITYSGVTYDTGASPIAGVGYTTQDVAWFSQDASHQLYQLYVVDKNGQMMPETVVPGGYVQLTYSGCDHLSRDCPFNKLVTQKNMHVNARTAHALGTSNWALPHTAQQYNS